MPFLGELSALLTACLWSFGALVFASATRRAGPVQVNVTRLLLALLYLAILIPVAGFGISMSASQVTNLAISGVIGLTLGDSFLFRAFHELGARISMLVMSSAPAIGAILAFFMMGEAISIWGIVGILVTLAGVILVVSDPRKSEHASVSGTGLLFAFLAAAGQGAGLVFAKMAFAEGEINGFVATFVRVGASLVFLVPATFLMRQVVSPMAFYRRDRKGFGLTALGAVLGPFLGIAFSLIAVKHTSVGVAATIMATVPIIMLPIVHFVYKEKLTLRAIAGAIVAVGGVAILFLR